MWARKGGGTHPILQLEMLQVLADPTLDVIQGLVLRGEAVGDGTIFPLENWVLEGWLFL